MPSLVQSVFHCFGIFFFWHLWIIFSLCVWVIAIFACKKQFIVQAELSHSLVIAAAEKHSWTLAVKCVLNAAGGCHVEVWWTRECCLIISHPNSCPGAKSQRIAETWCNTCVILPFETSNSSLWTKSIFWIGISDHWPNSICNRCLFVPSPQWLLFISPSLISRAGVWASSIIEIKKQQPAASERGKDGLEELMSCGIYAVWGTYLISFWGSFATGGIWSVCKAHPGVCWCW